MLWLVVAWAITRVEFKVCRWNLRSSYNGYGCIDAVVRREALAPMAYRVLIPWAIGFVERIAPATRRHRLTALYLPARIALLAAGLAVAERAVGVAGALLVAALVAVTFHFEYWDWSAELLGLAGALSGDLALATVGASVHALSRPETAPLTAVTWLLGTGDIAGGMWIGAWVVLWTGLVWLRVGRRALYCPRSMWRQNLRDVRGLLANRPAYLSEMGVTLALTAGTLAIVGYALAAGVLLRAWPVPLAILAAGWWGARAAESRVFGTVLLWWGMAA